MQVMKRSHTGSSLLLDSSTVPVSAEKASPHLGHRHLCRPAGVLPSLEQSGKPHDGQGGLGRQSSAASARVPAPIRALHLLSATAEQRASNPSASSDETRPP